MNIAMPPSDEDTAFRKARDYRLFLQEKWFSLILFVVAFILILYFVHYFFNKPAPNKPASPVVTARVQSKTVPITLSALGNVVATYTVTVKTQINGLLMNVFFKEGQYVKKGEPLADIDNRPLLAQLTQYQGQLKRDEALLANALIDLKRYQVLWKQNSVSQQTLATQEALVKQYQGAVQVDLGLIEQTKVNLIYSHITSPIDGRVGLRLVDPGNIVQTTDTTGIAVLTSLNPITVIFTLPEDNIAAILPKVMSNTPLQVEAYDRQQNHLLATGTLITMNNQIDPTTGTVSLRAQFENKNNALFSNQFVNIKIRVDTLQHANVIPTAAIQYNTQSKFVFRLNPDSTVTAQPITVGVTSGDETVVIQGLTTGQQVVVEGADKLSNGMQVNVAHSSKGTAH